MSMTIQTGTTTYAAPLDSGKPPTGTTQTGTTQTGNVQNGGVGGGVGGVGSGQVPTTGGQTNTSVMPRANGGGEPPTNTVQSERSLANARSTQKEALSILDTLIKALRDPDQLAALLIEMNEMQRQNSLDQRLASRETAKSQLEGQAAETRQAAVKEMAAAAVALAMSVVSFAISVAGAGNMGKEAKQASTASKTATEFKDAAADLKGKLGSVTDPAKRAELEKSIGKLEIQAGKFEAASNAGFREVDRINMLTQAVNSLVKGLGEGIEGMLRASAKMDEAQGQTLAANAEDTRADADALKAFTDAIDELLRAALEFIQKMNDAQVELMASASRL